MHTIIFLYKEIIEILQWVITFTAVHYSMSKTAFKKTMISRLFSNDAKSLSKPRMLQLSMGMLDIRIVLLMIPGSNFVEENCRFSTS